MENPKIILNCIVKNEAHVLPRMLKSVLPLIDEYQILDTGSTDNTIQVIEDFFKGLEITGSVVVNTSCTEMIDGRETFIYDKARNAALELLNQYKDQEVFGMWMDADDQLELPNNFDINKFKSNLEKFDKVNFTVIYDNTMYSKCYMFRLSKNFYWKGKAHENLMCDDSILETTLPEIKILVSRNGNSWKEDNAKEKYLSHIRIFEKEVEANNHPRDVFYLAKSHQSAGQAAQAVEWFKKRADMKDVINEENYYSQFMMSVIKSTIGVDYREVFFDLLACSDFDDKKAEHILYIILILKELKLWQAAYIFSKFAVENYHKKNPYPTRTMIIDSESYDHKLLDIHKIICKQLGKMIELSSYMTANEIYTDIVKESSANEYLVALKGYASGCKSVTDLSLVYGHFTYAFLSAKPKTIIRYGLHHNSGVKQLKMLSEKEKIGFEFINRDVNRFQIKETDLLFMDTIVDTYPLSKKLKIHSNNVKKHIIVYGINDGSKKSIEEFLDKNTEWNLSDLYTNDNGLAVMHRGKWDSDRTVKFSDF